MKVHNVYFFLLVALVSCKDRVTDLRDDEPINVGTDITEILADVVNDDEIPGVIAAIIDSEGVRIIDAVGVRKAGSEEPLTTDDFFHLGSCTKAMTSTMLATLVEEGLLSWDTTFIEIFPELESEVNKEFHTVTLQQFLTHRSGVPANASDWSSFSDLELTERRLAIIKANLQDPSAQGIGEFLYSNLGYTIAGSMAEKVTGKTWETLVQERLFEPLGMATAGFGIPSSPDQTDQPWGHYKSSGEWTAIQIDNPEAIGPAGTVHSSLEDWAKFVRLQLPDAEPKILNREQLDHLIEPTGEYASGWFVVSRSWADGTAYVHNGSNTTWYVVVWVAPALDRAYMVGLNSFDDQSFYVGDKVVGKLIEYDLAN